MRWFVDVSSVGRGADKSAYCVDADSWQRALQVARLLRDDPGPMTGFSIELLDNGFSAIDPVKRLRYSIRKAPDDAALTPPPGDAPAAASPTSDAGAKGDDAPSKGSRSSRPPAPDLNLRPKGAQKAKGRTTPPPAAVEPRAAAPAAAPAPPAAPLHELTVLAQREHDPGPDAPLTYREFAYLVPGSLEPRDLERLLREHLARIRQSLASAKPGKLVNLALFDVAFTGRPGKPPLATLIWKDWRGDEGVVEFARVAPVEAAPAPPSEPAPVQLEPVIPVAVEPIAVAPIAVEPLPPVASAAAVVHDGESAIPAQAETVSPSLAPPASLPPPSIPASLRPMVTDQRGTPLKAFPEPAARREPIREEAPPSSDGPATTRAPEPAGAFHGANEAPPRRLFGDELIADLFESMHDLQFLRDAIEGADFCLTMALEKMLASGGVVHLYDIDRREFVVTCAGGSGGESLLRQRNAESDPVLASAMRKRSALVIPDAGASESVRTRARYQALGGARSLVVAPVALGGRFVGAIELLNPIDGRPFTDDDGHALSYIAEQLAGFVGQRGIVLEREQAAQPAGRPSRAR